MEKGLIQVYTGEGKGKTTAALGLAFRAAGQGFRVYILQFLKGSDKVGEYQAARLLPNLTIEQCGLKGFIKGDEPLALHQEKAAEGFGRAGELIKNEEYDLVILDEISVALDYGLISLEEVVKLVKGKPSGVELVLTGRNAPPEIIDLADLVSEVRMIKHPYARGIKARRGIEF